MLVMMVMVQNRCRFVILMMQQKIAQPGDEVWVAPGVYREYVDPVHAGREDARITYRSVEPLGAVITGAERNSVMGSYKENVWVCRVANSLFWQL